MTPEKIEEWRGVWTRSYGYTNSPQALTSALKELNAIADLALIGLASTRPLEDMRDDMIRFVDEKLSLPQNGEPK